MPLSRLRRERGQLETPQTQLWGSAPRTPFGEACGVPNISKGANQMTTENSQANSTVKQNRGGLEGVVAARTALSKVEGTAGRLIYHGYNIHDLARTSSFE